MVGVSRPTVYRWVADAGGVNPFGTRAPAGRYLSFEEREEIAVLSAAGVSVRETGRRLGRSPSTICRELARGSLSRGYRPSSAQARVDQARHRRRPQRVKLLRNPRLRAQVQAYLHEAFSPEQIAGRLAIDYPDDPEMRLSAETIYQALYVQARGGLAREVAAALRSGRTMRKPRRREGGRLTRFPGMVMITDRPAEADDRAVPGHWEGDLILGAAGSRSAIGTLVERTTGFLLLLHLPDGYAADNVADAMARKISDLPTALQRSVTWDQGTEMAQHATFTINTGIPVYFCNPHSPWQRGSNENTNGLLRQYFPKSTDLSRLTEKMIDDVAAQMNARPRKRHGFLTPAEVLDRLLDQDKPPGVASVP
jgi:IS30 family transposase